MCNSCGRLLPQVDTSRLGAQAGPVAKLFVRSARWLGISRRFSVSDAEGRLLFRVVSKGFIRRRVFDFLAQQVSPVDSAFSVRSLSTRFGTTSWAYRVEDHGGGVIGTVRFSPFSWSSTLRLEPAAGPTISSTRPAYASWLTFALVFIPYVGHLAPFLGLLGSIRNVDLRADGERVATYRRTFNGVAIEIYSSDEVDRRLLLAGALFIASMGMG